MNTHEHPWTLVNTHECRECSCFSWKRLCLSPAQGLDSSGEGLPTVEAPHPLPANGGCPWLITTSLEVQPWDLRMTQSPFPTGLTAGGPRLSTCFLTGWGVRNPPHPWTTGIKRGARHSWAGAGEGHWGRDLPAASVLAPGTSLFQEGGGAHLLLSSRQPPQGQGRANGWCAPGLRGDPSGHLPGCRVSGSSKTVGVGILLFTLGLGSTQVAFPAPIQSLRYRVCVGGDDRSGPPFP